MEINKYSMREAAKKAPDRPGVYVWYCCLCIGKADIQNDEALLNLLDSYTTKFGRQQMLVTASLNFDLTWQGRIFPEETVKKSRFLSEEGLNDRSRELISGMLQAAGPFFYQPLYIGKAERSIKNRLNQHITEFFRLKELIMDFKDSDYEGEDDFAQRAVTLGYSEDQLVVHTLDLGEANDLSQEQVGRTISLVEMYLNKWSTPILGRK